MSRDVRQGYGFWRQCGVDPHAALRLARSIAAESESPSCKPPALASLGIATARRGAAPRGEPARVHLRVGGEGSAPAEAIRAPLRLVCGVQSDRREFTPPVGVSLCIGDHVVIRRHYTEGLIGLCGYVCRLLPTERDRDRLGFVAVGGSADRRLSKWIVVARPDWLGKLR